MSSPIVNGIGERNLLSRLVGALALRSRRLGIEATGDTIEALLEGYPWLGREDVLACLAYAYRLVAHERVEPLLVETVQ